MRYTREDGCRAWLTYAMPRADALCDLLDEFGAAEAIYDRFIKAGGEFLKKWINAYGVEQLEQHASREQMHEMLRTMQKQDMGIMARGDLMYPDSLRNIQSPPGLLFYRGNPECAMGKCVSVVGSRKASIQGVEATQKLCCELSQAGVTIVSGLAMGIDAAAHEGCLDGGSPTIAVLGCGIDVDYPVENLDLKERIVEHGGLLLSEYPPGTRANRHVFQVRNRIMAGLGKALIMMESRIQSGSMLSVHHALDQGKDVFAYPGIPGTEWAEGAHQLLREGANYFTCAKDILEDLGWENDVPQPTVEQKKSLPPMTDEQKRIFTLLSRGEMSFDQLAFETGMATPALSIALTMLQMSGVIKALPGKMYCRS